MSTLFIPFITTFLTKISNFALKTLKLSNNKNMAEIIFPTKLASSNFYGCKEDYYEENLEDFIETLTELKPMVEKMLEDLSSSDEVIRYEYDCWY